MDIVNSIKIVVNPYIIYGTEEIPNIVPENNANNSAIYILRVVDTSNVTQLPTFESHVKLCAEAHVIIAEHGAFHTNLIFMRQDSLLVDLRGNYNNPATVTFENIAEMFGIFYRYVVTTDMKQHNQDSFVITSDEIQAVCNLVLEYFRQGQPAGL
jgi:hypothetical protein